MELFEALEGARKETYAPLYELVLPIVITPTFVILTIIKSMLTQTGLGHLHLVLRRRC